MPTLPAQRRLNYSQALFLINTYYTSRYGERIQSENPRSMRRMIVELEAELEIYRNHPMLYTTLVRQLVDYERICRLHEYLQY